VIKLAYSFSFLLSINIFEWQNVLYFLDAPRRSTGVHEALEPAKEICSGRHALEIAKITVTYIKCVCVFSKEDQLLTNTTLALRNRKRPRSRDSG